MAVAVIEHLLGQRSVHEGVPAGIEAASQGAKLRQLALVELYSGNPHQMQGLPRSTYACVGNPHVRTLTAITRRQHDYGLGNSPHQMQEWPRSTYACPSQQCVEDLRERRLRAMTRQSHVQQKDLKLLTKPVHIKQSMDSAAAMVADQNAECMQNGLVMLW